MAFGQYIIVKDILYISDVIYEKIISAI